MSANADHPSEVELKFSLSREAADEISNHRLLESYGHQRHSQHTTYFDTAESELRERGYSLRVRQIGETFTQTLKSRGGRAGLFDRAEWEMPVPSMQPDLKALTDAGIGKLSQIDGSLSPVISSDVDRTTWLLDHDGSTIEVVLDAGSVSAFGEDADFHELELELKQGDPPALFAVARTLIEDAPLRLGVLTKHERGEMLAEEQCGAHKAEDQPLDRNMTVEQVFSGIVQSCLRQFRLNEKAVLEDSHEEALHQARVATRRLRGALALFGPATKRSSIEPLRQELRWLTGSLRDARDIDVFLAGHEGLARSDRKKLKAARREAYQQVHDAIDSQRLRRLMLGFVEWLAIGGWQKREARQKIRKFAAKRLDAMWEKLDEKAAHLADLDDHQLHRLRIHAKKFRYALDFLGSLYGKKARKFSAEMERVQDCLGEMVDASVSRQLIARFALKFEPDAAIADAQDLRVHRVRKSFKAMRKIGPFWA